MEKNIYTDDFELMLKERSDEFRMYPSKRVWHSIYNDLHPSRKWPSIAVSLLLITTLIITGYWNNNKHTTASSTNSVNSISALKNNFSTKIQQSIVKNSRKEIEPPSTSSTLIQPTPATKKFPDNETVNIKNTTTHPISSTDIAYIHTTKASKNSALHFEDNLSIDDVRKLQEPIPNLKALNSSNTVASVNKFSSKNKDALGNKSTDLTIANTKLAAENLSTIKELSGNESNITSLPVTLFSTEENNVNNINTFPSIKSNSVNENKKIEVATAQSTNQRIISIQDKAWIDNDAFYNKSKRKKWKDRATKEFYFTPSVSFRNFSNNSGFDAITNGSLTVPFSASSLNATLHQKPGIGFEAGIGWAYSLSKKLRLKVGIQANTTSYVIYGEETNHPVLTTLRLTNINTGFPYLDPRTATLANSGMNTVKIHNSTYQVSIPLGFSIKIAGADKLEWYAGASVQPTLVLFGKANLISDDRKNYVSDPSLIRRWNLNAGFETYIHYKFDGFTLQAGPQFRYQLLSTYANQYTINENLYNIGLKIGILKNF